MNTLRQAVDDYLELRRGLGFKLVNHGACLGEFVSFLEQKKTSQITTALSVQFLQPRSLRSVWSEDARSARVRISTLTKKSANCWKPRGIFPPRIVCGLGPTIAFSVCWQ